MDNKALSYLMLARAFAEMKSTRRKVKKKKKGRGRVSLCTRFFANQSDTLSPQKLERVLYATRQRVNLAKTSREDVSET